MLTAVTLDVVIVLELSVDCDGMVLSTAFDPSFSGAVGGVGGATLVIKEAMGGSDASMGSAIA